MGRDGSRIYTAIQMTVVTLGMDGRALQSLFLALRMADMASVWTSRARVCATACKCRLDLVGCEKRKGASMVLRVQARAEGSVGGV